MENAYCPQCGAYNRMYRPRSLKRPEIDFVTLHTEVCWDCLCDLAIFYNTMNRILSIRRSGTDENLSILR